VLCLCLCAALCPLHISCTRAHVHARPTLGRKSTHTHTHTHTCMLNSKPTSQPCRYLISVVSITAIGRIGAIELAAAALATSIYTVTGHSLVLGLSSAMETLCGQAYGAQDYKALGEILQRALLVCWVSGRVAPYAIRFIRHTPEIRSYQGEFPPRMIPI
jgi:hypothetical protein